MSDLPDHERQSPVILHISEIPLIASRDLRWRPIRHAMGLGSFGINSWHAEKEDDRLLERHNEIDSAGAGLHEELYLVMSGTVRFILDGTEVLAHADTLVSVPPACEREAFAVTADAAVIAIGAPPDGAFQPSAWEQRLLQAAGQIPAS